MKVVGSLAAAVEHSEARKGGAHAGVSEDAAVKPVRHNARWEKREEGRGGGGMSLQPSCGEGDASPRGEGK